MQPLAVVVNLDEFEDGSASLVSAGKAFSGINQFPFKRRPETFDDGVVEASLLAGKTGAHSLASKFSLIKMAGILAFPARLVDQSRRGLTLSDCTPQNLHHEVGLHMLSHRVANHAFRKTVDNARQVEPTLMFGDISNVDVPELIDSGNLEPVLQ